MMNQDNRPYVLWRRVSTKEQGKSGLGLDAQQEIAEYFMKGTPIKVFTDVYSGTKLAECPNLNKAISYCKQHKLLLVIAKTDRFRNVKQALDILDELGEGNLCFCDLPTTDRTVLTIVFSIWERQALMGRINTQKALDVRKRQLAKDGAFISKAGNLCTHLGRNKGCDTSPAVEAASRKRQEELIRWKEESIGYRWAIDKVREGMPRLQIVEEFNKQHKYQPDIFCTRNGKPLSKGVLSRWISEANLLVV